MFVVLVKSFIDELISYLINYIWKGVLLLAKITVQQESIKQHVLRYEKGSVTSRPLGNLWQTDQPTDRPTDMRGH